MPKKTTAAATEYLARGRIKSSGRDKNIVNGEEVRTKLARSTICGYTRSLRLWDQYFNQSGRYREPVFQLTVALQISNRTPIGQAGRHRVRKGLYVGCCFCC